MPLHAERKARRFGDADGLDRFVPRHTLDNNASARLENALAVQGIDPNAFGAKQFANAPPGVSRTSWRSAKITSTSGWNSPFGSRGAR